MCSLRALWLIHSNGNILFSRRFPTVERRYRLLAGDDYRSVPDDSTFFDLFRQEVIDVMDAEAKSNKRVVERDDDTQEVDEEADVVTAPQTELFTEQPQTATWPHGPVVGLDNNSVWPVTFIFDRVYFVAVPFVEPPCSPSTSLVQIPSITASFVFLQDIFQFLVSSVDNLEAFQFTEFQTYLNSACPFGTPIDTDVSNIRMIHRTGFPANESIQKKRPAWKPYLFRGKQRMEIVIQEDIRCVQCGPDNPLHTKAHIVGSILCRPDLLGVPDVTVPVTHSLGPLNSFVVHTCARIQSPDAISMDTTRISFSPPLGMFILGRYQIDDLPVVPIEGEFEAKEVSGNQLALSLQLKLNDVIHGTHFEFCQVTIPFNNRPPVISMNITASVGTVTFGNGRNSIIWKLGQRFNSRRIESLEGEVIFPNDESITSGTNSFVQLDFRVPQFSLGGVSVDGKAVTIYPSTKADITVRNELITSSYVIWNRFRS
eukprot:GILK01006322.1.p1 GENE.GILK01006322.1~~GILK01006322.1.p1  ORF type:complete len:485 (+),score=57.00 GILK01006322.1:67-1521(+)